MFNPLIPYVLYSIQEIIKVREWIPHTAPLTKVIHLNLFLDIVPCFSAEITRELPGCFREGSIYMYVVSFRFVSKQRKTSNAVGMSSLIFWLQVRELRLSLCFNTFRNFNRSLNKRRMSPAQVPQHKLSNRTNRWSKVDCVDFRKRNF